MKSCRIRVSPKCSDSCPYEKMRRHRPPCDGRGREWGDAPASHGVTRIAQSHGELGVGQRTASPSEPPGEPAWHPLDCGLPELHENESLLFSATKFVVIYYGSPRKLIVCGLSLGRRRVTVHSSWPHLYNLPPCLPLASAHSL